VVLKCEDPVWESTSELLACDSPLASRVKNLEADRPTKLCPQPRPQTCMCASTTSYYGTDQTMINIIVVPNWHRSI